jgi:hypothetical protein
MPVFEAKNLDCEFEGQALLAAILHPTRAVQVSARINGRRRTMQPATMTDATAIKPRFPVRSDEFASTPVATT